MQRRHHLHLPPHFTLHRHKQDVPPRALRRGSSAVGARKAVVAGSRHSKAAAVLSNTDARSVIMMASKAEASSSSVSVVRERKEKSEVRRRRRMARTASLQGVRAVYAHGVSVRGPGCYC